MELTDKEFREMRNLEDARASRTVPMFQYQQDRLAHLKSKLYHNDCLNPRCQGFTGRDIDTECPYCGEPLYRMNESNVGK